MAVNRADSVAIDIEGSASLKEEDMVSNDPFLSPNCCIFKTPNVLYRQNEKAYVPNGFSIGPFHHNKPNLTDTEKKKKKKKTMLEDLINSVKEVQQEARECYSEPFHYSPDKFVEILVIDGCFIIELFRKMANVVPIENNDPVFTMPFMMGFLCHDLILLENQVPWMVLERLFNMTMNSDENKPEDNERLVYLAINCISTFSRFTPPPMKKRMKGIKHIPDLIIKWMVSSIEEDEQIPKEGCQHVSCATSFLEAAIKFIRGEPKMISSEKDMPSATTLVEAGIKFNRVENKSILDIKFKDGVLEFPALFIQENTESVLRNLISFEQCYPNCEGRFTYYAILLDDLITTAKDVDILGNAEIIDIYLPSPEVVAQLFNKLCRHMLVRKSYYESVRKDVNRYCQRRWPRWRAAIVRNYFNTPWSVLSTMAAVILLILTFLQTLHTMK
ncbi:UPF0481 protein At3g47200-like [Fagus crenata]